MSLGPGTRLGPYEILSAIGAGGMGEVYKARDTRLDRTVAIKVLPEHVAADPDLKQRFEREAKTISSLNHPHICTLYDVGNQDGIDFLVMEYLEGETLEQRLKRRAGPKGPGLQMDQALQIAIQIADALAAAHRAGIIHRDLKPGNIMLTISGAKLLDFGLAKLHPTPATAGISIAATVSRPLTGQGTLLGTLHYMAPEQVEGKDADSRSDIFAFGAVMYEMATGKRAFDGKSAASVIAAILEREPPAMSTLQPLTPPPLDHVVSQCLEKDPARRWETAGDVMRQLKWIAVAPGAGAAVTTTARHGSERVAWALLAVAVLGLIAFAVPTTRYVMRTVPAAAPLRLSAELGVEVSLDNNPGAAAALSPDGAVLAFVAQQTAGGRLKLYVRRLEQLQAAPLAGTDGATSPFFSPDGQWIAFFADGKLKKISVTGGAAVTLCDAPTGRGGAWAEDGTIAFNPSTNAGTSLMRVSAAGGNPEPLTTLGEGEVTQRWPQVLPGGKAVLYTSHSGVVGFDEANLVVQTLPSGPRKIVQRAGYYGRYLLSGHLAYVYEGTLFAAPFDLDRLEVTGQPAPVLEGVDVISRSGGANFAVSGNGTMVYLPGLSADDQIPFQWMDRTGKTTPLQTAAALWSNPQFAPDGRRLAIDIYDRKQTDVWIYEWDRGTMSRLTLDPGLDQKPVWTPDSRRIAFASRRADKSTFNIYWQQANGTGELQRLTESRNPQAPSSWHPSGKVLAFFEQRPETNDDVLILPVEGDEASGWKPGTPTVFLSGPSRERDPMFSPDGRWLAYVSNESGRSEVYVQPFPASSGRWQISTGGGTFPTWSRIRHELFYSTPDQIMVVPYVAEGDSFRADKPQLWSERRFLPRAFVGLLGGRSFDLHPDGERFALPAVPEAQIETRRDKLVFIFNFFDELRRIAPATAR